MRKLPLPLRKIAQRQNIRKAIRLSAALAIAIAAEPAGTQSAPGASAAVQEQACSLPGLTPDLRRAPTTDDLLAAYNSQAALLHSLRGSLILRGQGQARPDGKTDNPRPFPAMLIFRSPAWVRLTGVIPFSARRSFDLASDGRSFRLLMPDGKVMRLIVGSVDALETSPDPRENIRPRMVLEAIHWLPAKLRKPPTPAENHQIQTIDVSLRTSAGEQVPAQLAFNLQNGTLARLVIPDPGGQSASEVDYTDWQTAPDAGSGDRKVCFPRRMYITQPQQNRHLEMKFESVQVNASAQPGDFQLVPPRGVVVSRAGEAGNPAKSSTTP
jgi:hypothetical protein